MADIPGKDDSTSGPLGWLLAVPLILLTVGLPAVVVTALLLALFVVLDSVVGLPTVSIGLLELLGVPTEFGLPVLFAVVPGLLTGLGLAARNGFDWAGTETDADRPGDGPFR